MNKINLNKIAVYTAKPKKVFIGLPKTGTYFRTHPDDKLENVRLMYLNSAYYLLDASVFNDTYVEGETVAHLFRGVDENEREWIFIASLARQDFIEAFECAKDKWLTRIDRTNDYDERRIEFITSDYDEAPQWSHASFEELINLAFENHIMTEIGIVTH